MERFAKQYPGITVKGLKFFRGMEGHGFNASIYMGGKKLCFTMDEGSGGEPHYDWEEGGERTLQTLVEIKRAEIPADQESDGFNDREMFCLDIMVEDILIAWEREKNFLRDLKRKTIFDVKGELREINRPFDPKIKQHLVAKYGPQIEILNETWVTCG